MGYVFKDKRRGREAWAIGYNDVDGRHRKERTKAANRTLARRILADREDAVERARLQNLKSVKDLIAPKTCPTIRVFSEEYQTHVEAQCSPTTEKRYRYLLKHAILPKLGSLTLKEATAGHIQKYADERLKEMAPATARQELMYFPRGRKARHHRPESARPGRQALDQQPDHPIPGPRRGEAPPGLRTRAAPDRDYDLHPQRTP